MHETPRVAGLKTCSYVSIDVDDDVGRLA